MSDMVVVYESNVPFWADEVMDALREEGFHPALADDAGAAYHSMDNKNPGVVGMPQGRMKVSIVVPRQEEVAAWLFLQKRDEQAGGISYYYKTTGAYTEINQYRPRINTSFLQFNLTVELGFKVLVHRDEYHRSITYLHRRHPI
jgi:hypothetical protein